MVLESKVLVWCIAGMSGVDISKRTLIRDLFSKGRVGEEYVVAGWVDAIRVHGGIVFVILRDRSGRIQLVVKKNVSRDAWRKARDLSLESIVVAKGRLVESKAALGGRELQVTELEVLAEADPLPIDIHEPEKTVLAKRLDWRFLDLRNPRNQLIFLVEAEMARAARQWFVEHGFVEIFTPKIVGSATEGGAEVFTVVYFDKPAYLAQSPQLYKQMGVVAGFEKVFEIGPAFRAEPHHTTRHLTEYTSIDFEMGFIKSYEDVMDVVEGVVKAMIEAAIRKYGDVIREYFPDAWLEPIKEVPRIDIVEAKQLLAKKGKKLSPEEDLDTEAERMVGEIVLEEYGSPLVFVKGYPWGARPFYTMPCTCTIENPRYPECCKGLRPDTPTCSFDLLFRGLEIATGGQRQHNPQCLVEQIKQKGLNPENFKWYIDMFRFGAPPHGGAGIGLERVAMQLLGLKNIREARLVPRDPERLVP